MTESSTCPLCGSPSHRSPTTSPDGFLVTCPNCTEFWIDAYSEAQLNAMPKTTAGEARVRLARDAKGASFGRRLVIRQPRADEIRGDGRRAAQEGIKTEFVNRQHHS